MNYSTNKIFMETKRVADGTLVTTYTNRHRGRTFAGSEFRTHFSAVPIPGRPQKNRVSPWSRRNVEKTTKTSSRRPPKCRLQDKKYPKKTVFTHPGIGESTVRPGIGESTKKSFLIPLHNRKFLTSLILAARP